MNEDRRAYLTEKKREARQRARAEGRCIMCTANAVTLGLVTCRQCREGVSDSRQQYRDWITAVYAEISALSGLRVDDTGSDRWAGDARVVYTTHSDGTVAFGVSLPKEPLHPRAQLDPVPWRTTEPAKQAQAVVTAYEALRSTVLA